MKGYLTGVPFSFCLWFLFSRVSEYKELKGDPVRFFEKKGD
jgi:hypothetical protein